MAIAFAAWACAPGATVERTPYFMATWNGPIETAAIVMTPPPSSMAPLASAAYNLTSLEFIRHPYVRQRFDIVERNVLDRVTGELGLGQSGLVDTSTAPRVGQLIGASYMVVFDLVNISVRPVSLGGIDIGGVNLGLGMAELDVTLMVRMVDVETGRVRATGSGRVQDAVFTRISLDGMDFGSPASRELVLDLVPEAALRALNDLFRQIV
jgi:hypothetical protein